MEQKSVGASILIVYLAVLFAIIGGCFSTFVYAYAKTEIKEIKLIASSNISIFSDKELKVQAKSLELSKQELGLKPATGELDSETEIPSTITDEGTTEGYYATVYIKSDIGVKIQLKDIDIKTKNSNNKAQQERKNIFVAIKDVAGSTVSLEKDVIEIASFNEACANKKIVFLIWLGALAGDGLEGAKVSFNIEFLAV